MFTVVFMVKFSVLLGLFANTDAGLLENNVLKLIKEFQSRMCHDLDRFGIPALDPFKYKHFAFSFDNPMAQVSGSVSNVESTGLSSLKLTGLKVKPTLHMAFTATIPKVHLKGKFEAKGMLGELFPIDGEGSFKFTVEDLSIDTSFKLYSASEVYLENVKATPKVRKVHAEIENLVPSEVVNDFINDVINNRSPEILDALWEEIGAEVLVELEKLSKYLLRDVQSKDIAGIVAGKPIFNEHDPKGDCPVK